MTRIEKTGMCAQPLIRAGSIEHQIVQILLQAAQDAPDLVRSAQSQIVAADERYERAKFLYLAGDISREAFEEERKRRESTLGGLRGVTDGAIMVPVDEVYQSLVNWDSILPIERKKLLHAVLEAAFVRQNALVALQPVGCENLIRAIGNDLLAYFLASSVTCWKPHRLHDQVLASWGVCIKQRCKQALKPKNLDKIIVSGFLCLYFV